MPNLELEDLLCAGRYIMRWSPVAGATSYHAEKVILACAAVDLLVVETGKVDRWATAVSNRWEFVSRRRNSVCVGLVVMTALNLLWPLFVAT